MTDKQIIGGRGSAKPYTTLNTIEVMLENEKLESELNKYKQTLTEIKQLLEDALEYFHDSDTGSTYDKIELILQKCEVIDDI